VKISPAQAHWFATTEPFATQLREFLAAIAPLLAGLAIAQRRHRARIVTRRKQRRSW
jgi:hypothetical protein